MSQLSENSDTNFEDLIYTLKNTDPELVSAMSNAINFMGDYIQCIELDRFVGFDSEADLEWEAAKLSRTKNLLAGRFMFQYKKQHEVEAVDMVNLQ